MHVRTLPLTSHLELEVHRDGHRDGGKQTIPIVCDAPDASKAYLKTQQYVMPSSSLVAKNGVETPLHSMTVYYK